MTAIPRSALRWPNCWRDARDRLHGTVKFIFQPGEEGGRGALPMVKAGVVDDVDYFIAIHLGTGVPSRSFRPAVRGHLASAKLDVTFRGRAAHAGGRPEEGRNALLAAASAVVGLYGIARHHAGRSRINVGTLRAGSGRNVIADEATMAMEVRGETEAIADYMLERAEAVLKGAALAQDVTVEIKLAGRTTVATSDEGLSQRLARSLSGRIPGVEIDAASHVTGGSEDATYFMRRVQERGGQAIYAVVGSDIPFRPPHPGIRHRRDRFSLGDRGAGDGNPGAGDGTRCRVVQSCADFIDGRLVARRDYHLAAMLFRRCKFWGDRFSKKAR